MPSAYDYDRPRERTACAPRSHTSVLLCSEFSLAGCRTTPSSRRRLNCTQAKRAERTRELFPLHAMPAENGQETRQPSILLVRKTNTLFSHSASSFVFRVSQHPQLFVVRRACIQGATGSWKRDENTGKETVCKRMWRGLWENLANVSQCPWTRHCLQVRDTKELYYLIEHMTPRSVLLSDLWPSHTLK